MQYTRKRAKRRKTQSSLVSYRLLGTDRLDTLTREQRPFARKENNCMPLLDVIKTYSPTIIVGVTAVGDSLQRN